MPDPSTSEGRTPFYWSILFGEEWLNLGGQSRHRFLIDDPTKFERVLTRLSDAADAMHAAQVCYTGRDWAGVNMCVHVASAVVLLEVQSAGFERAQNKIRTESDAKGHPVFSEIDPSTVFTAAALYFLVNNLSANLSEYRKTLENKLAERQEEGKAASGDVQRQVDDIVLQIAELPAVADKMMIIRQRFDKLKWLVGDDAMRTLEIEAVEESR